MKVLENNKKPRGINWQTLISQMVWKIVCSEY